MFFLVVVVDNERNLIGFVILLNESTERSSFGYSQKM